MDPNAETISITFQKGLHTNMIGLMSNDKKNSPTWPRVLKNEQILKNVILTLFPKVDETQNARETLNKI